MTLVDDHGSQIIEDDGFMAIADERVMAIVDDGFIKTLVDDGFRAMLDDGFMAIVNNGGLGAMVDDGFVAIFDDGLNTMEGKRWPPRRLHRIDAVVGNTCNTVHIHKNNKAFSEAGGTDTHEQVRWVLGASWASKTHPNKVTVFALKISPRPSTAVVAARAHTRHNREKQALQAILRRGQ